MNMAILFAIFSSEFGSGLAEHANAVVSMLIIGFLYMMSPELHSALNELRRRAESRGESDE